MHYGMELESVLDDAWENDREEFTKWIRSLDRGYILDIWNDQDAGSSGVNCSMTSNITMSSSELLGIIGQDQIDYWPEQDEYTVVIYDGGGKTP